MGGRKNRFRGREFHVYMYHFETFESSSLMRRFVCCACSGAASGGVARRTDHQCGAGFTGPDRARLQSARRSPGAGQSNQESATSVWPTGFHKRVQKLETFSSSGKSQGETSTLSQRRGRAPQPFITSDIWAARPILSNFHFQKKI